MVWELAPEASKRLPEMHFWLPIRACFNVVYVPPPIH
jgi:hypothetical protein